jgi:hypothetical protein
VLNDTLGWPFDRAGTAGGQAELVHHSLPLVCHGQKSPENVLLLTGRSVAGREGIAHGALLEVPENKQETPTTYYHCMPNLAQNELPEVPGDHCKNRTKGKCALGEAVTAFFPHPSLSLCLYMYIYSEIKVRVFSVYATLIS